MYLRLTRLSDNGVQTTGDLKVLCSRGKVLASFDTLELSWKNNERQISCIPNGAFSVKPKLSFRFGWTLEVLEVEDRSAILIHQGNFNSQTKGCILIGHGLKDINGDFELDVLNSRIAMKQLLALVKKTETLFITTEFLDYELK